MALVAGGHTRVNYDAASAGLHGESIGGADDWHGDFAVGGAKFASFNWKGWGGSADRVLMGEADLRVAKQSLD